MCLSSRHPKSEFSPMSIYLSAVKEYIYKKFWLKVSKLCSVEHFQHDQLILRVKRTGQQKFSFVGILFDVRLYVPARISMQWYSIYLGSQPCRHLRNYNHKNDHWNKCWAALLINCYWWGWQNNRHCHCWSSSEAGTRRSTQWLLFTYCLNCQRNLLWI